MEVFAGDAPYAEDGKSLGYWDFETKQFSATEAAFEMRLNADIREFITVVSDHLAAQYPANAR